MKEFRISLPTQMVYLFLMSVVPTVPAGFLTFAGGALYDAYDHQVRLWGIDITTDQQLAGLVMELVGSYISMGMDSSTVLSMEQKKSARDGPS